MRFLVFDPHYEHESTSLHGLAVSSGLNLRAAVDLWSLNWFKVQDSKGPKTRLRCPSPVPSLMKNVPVSRLTKTHRVSFHLEHDLRPCCQPHANLRLAACGLRVVRLLQ